MSLSAAQLAALRQEYSNKGLRRKDLEQDPIAQFAKWLAEALTVGLLEPNAMILGTVDSNHQPWTRTVLLKACDERGFTFFTNYDGNKARQLEGNPKAALTFLWVPLERQINITGHVQTVSREESAAYFASRPRKSQLGAWASQQSAVVANRERLQQQLAAVEERFANAEVPLPERWGGYCVVPETIEFWQGRASRLHDRLRYSRTVASSWRVERLSP